jgi:SAM-dependent methyltransferase
VSQPEHRLALRSPPDGGAVPAFDDGWLRPDGSRDAYLRYAEGRVVNWSVELEELHAENSRDHFIEIWTRRAILERIGPLPSGATIADVGCSTGYLLEDLRTARPDARLVGVDLVESGLCAAHRNIPDAILLQADVCTLPVEDASFDAVVSANLLEHVPVDALALAELYRVLRPGARAVLVVPACPGVYDYYDRFLGHERRYARAELSAKARRAGFEVIEDIHLGSILFPAFWVAKQRNRRHRGHLQGAALAARVTADIRRTRSSRVGRLACEVECLMLRLGIRLPFGIRGLTVVRRPETGE